MNNHSLFHLRLPSYLLDIPLGADSMGRKSFVSSKCHFRWTRFNGVSQ